MLGLLPELRASFKSFLLQEIKDSCSKEFQLMLTDILEVMDKGVGGIEYVLEGREKGEGIKP